MTKKLFLACFCLLLSLPGISQAQEVSYQITETELTRLESSLTEQRVELEKALTRAIKNYIKFYNFECLQKGLGEMTPLEFYEILANSDS